MGETYRLEVPESAKLVEQEVPLRNAMNEVLRDEYVKDAKRAVDRWNKTLVRAGNTGLRFAAAPAVIHRAVGPCAGTSSIWRAADLRGRIQGARSRVAPTAEDRAYVKSLMAPGDRTRQSGLLDRAAGQGHHGMPSVYEVRETPQA